MTQFGFEDRGNACIQKEVHRQTISNKHIWNRLSVFVTHRMAIRHFIIRGMKDQDSCWSSKVILSKQDIEQNGLNTMVPLKLAFSNRLALRNSGA